MGPGELKSEMLGHERSLENHSITHLMQKMITQIRNTCSNGACTLKIHQDGAALGLNRPTLASGGQPLMSQGTRGHKSTTTVYTQLQTMTLKIMQWNTEGLVKKKTELEHILKEESIDICCIQETHLKKD